MNINKELFEKYPHLKVGVLTCTGIDNSKNCSEILEKIKEVQQHIKNNLSLETLPNHPKINDWRQAYTKFGAKPKTYKSSIESLLRRVLKGNDLPNINCLVNIYNYISVKHLLPAGGDDLDCIQGDIALTFSQGGEKFTLLGGRKIELVNAGEVVYKDDDEVLCRRWNWRECNKSKMTLDTKNVSLVLEALESTSEEELKKALVELKELVETYCGGTTTMKVISKPT